MRIQHCGFKFLFISIVEVCMLPYGCKCVPLRKIYLHLLDKQIITLLKHYIKWIFKFIFLICKLIKIGGF